jgi:hypothetical protein
MLLPEFPFLQQVDLSGAGDGLTATLRLKLAEDIVEVFFDRTDNQEQFLGNFLVRPTGGDEAEQFRFAVDERSTKSKIG